MEYLRVSLAPPSNKKISVLVNGRKNGFVGGVLTLETGFVKISADLPTAKSKVVELLNTTPTKPMEVTVQC